MQLGHKTLCRHLTLLLQLAGNLHLGWLTVSTRPDPANDSLSQAEKAMHAILWDALSFQRTECTMPVLKQFLAAFQA